MKLSQKNLAANMGQACDSSAPAATGAVSTPFFFPNLVTSCTVTIDGQPVRASNDLGTTLSGYLIDIAFLRRLPSLSQKQVEPVHPSQAEVVAIVPMTVVGVIR